jgi:hypothetical protein
VKRFSLAALVCLAMLATATAAQASTLDDAVAALKKSHVYIAPGTEGTDSDTAGELAAQLSKGDNLAIVMLPAGSVSGDLSGFASTLNQQLGGKLILGLVAGDQVVAYSTLLPVGVAGGLMHSAQNVSTNTVETLSTFIQNVHNWQAQNPNATASKPQKKHSKKSGGFPVWAIILIVMVGIASVIWYALIRSHRRDPISGEEYMHFRSPVRDELEKLAELRAQVADPQMQRTLTQICKDVEAYFTRFSSNPENDSGAFRTHLENLNSVVRKYVQIQNDDPRYYDDAQGAMNSARQAVDDFADFVVHSIQRGSRAELTEFHVNTDILSAQRYR